MGGEDRTGKSRKGPSRATIHRVKRRIHQEIAHDALVHTTASRPLRPPKFVIWLRTELYQTDFVSSSAKHRIRKPNCQRTPSLIIGTKRGADPSDRLLGGGPRFCAKLACNIHKITICLKSNFRVCPRSKG